MYLMSLNSLDNPVNDVRDNSNPLFLFVTIRKPRPQIVGNKQLFLTKTFYKFNHIHFYSWSNQEPRIFSYAVAVILMVKN